MLPREAVAWNAPSGSTLFLLLKRRPRQSSRFEWNLLATHFETLKEVRVRSFYFLIYSVAIPLRGLPIEKLLRKTPCLRNAKYAPGSGGRDMNQGPESLEFIIASGVIWKSV